MGAREIKVRPKYISIRRLQNAAAVWLFAALLVSATCFPAHGGPMITVINETTVPIHATHAQVNIESTEKWMPPRWLPSQDQKIPPEARMNSLGFVS